MSQGPDRVCNHVLKDRRESTAKGHLLKQQGLQGQRVAFSWGYNAKFILELDMSLIDYIKLALFKNIEFVSAKAVAPKEWRYSGP